MNILILTPISLEREAVLEHLEDVDIRQDGPMVYWSGNFRGAQRSFDVFVSETGSRESAIALASEKAILKFRPSVVFLIGIAGGVKDVGIGDVAVGTKAYSYETGKDTENGFVYRPDVYLSSQSLVGLAKMTSVKNNWQKRSRYAQGKKVEFGPIASGNKVIASTDSHHYRNIKKHLNDTIALEMEAAGFCRAVSAHPHIHAINIRSISDLLNHKSAGDEQGLQQQAAANAAAFAFEMLHHLQPEQLNLPIMTTKELVKTVYEHVLPAIQSEIKGQPAQGDIWEKVKPLLATELNELKADPDDEDSLTAVRITLKRALKQNELLKSELEGLLKTNRGDGIADNSVKIQNSNNVISDSNISVGANLHLGDKNKIAKNFDLKDNQGQIYFANTINIEKAASAKADRLKSAALSEVKMQVLKNRIKPALETLLEHSAYDLEWQNQIILLASRWNQLESEKNMSIVTKGQANMETNRIRAALLNIIDEMEY
ncbi:MAG: hypothetical protein AAFZ15_17660 [Bacteroidota bacterium]